MSLLAKDGADSRPIETLLLVAIAAWIGIAHLSGEAGAYEERSLLAGRIASSISGASTFTNAAQADQTQSNQLSRKRESTSVKILDRGSPAEQWILAQVKVGQNANLKDRFPNEADRVIDAAFIKMLLIGRYSSIDIADAYGVHISNAKISGILNLTNHEIPHDTSLTDCIFDDEVRLIGTKFRASLNLDGSTFAKAADFRYLSTGTSLSLNRSVFDGWANFYRIKIESNLAADEKTQFNDAKAGVSFEGMTVGGYAFFRNAVFKGPARFYGANVGDNFEANDATFSATSPPTNFENMQIDANALFLRTTFNGRVRFHNTKVGGSFETGDNDAGAHFNGEVDFTNVTADAVGFPHTAFAGPIVLRGMKYLRMSSGVPDNLLWMLNRSAYDSSSYAQLEQYCRQIGDLDKANEVYIQKRQRERSQLSIGSKIGNLMLDWLVGYGRRPWRALLWTAIVVIGAASLVFRKNKMQARNLEDQSKHYSAFLYSLDLLLPIVDLQSASIWTPKPESHLARRYLPIHVILGWILATILAGTLTGILK